MFPLLPWILNNVWCSTTLPSAIKLFAILNPSHLSGKFTTSWIFFSQHKQFNSTSESNMLLPCYFFLWALLSSYPLCISCSFSTLCSLSAETFDIMIYILLFFLYHHRQMAFNFIHRKVLLVKHQWYLRSLYFV